MAENKAASNQYFSVFIFKLSYFYKVLIYSTYDYFYLSNRLFSILILPDPHS